MPFNTKSIHFKEHRRNKWLLGHRIALNKLVLCQHFYYTFIWSLEEVKTNFKYLTRWNLMSNWTYLMKCMIISFVFSTVSHYSISQFVINSHFLSFKVQLLLFLICLYLYLIVLRNYSLWLGIVITLWENWNFSIHHYKLQP